MKIRHIEIKNFRGISSLEWAPSEHMNCLIGAGDAGKTTILDAIELTLAPRYQANFDDADFFKGKHEQPIQLTITLGDLPEGFKELTKYGEYLRGWDAEKQVIIDEPDEGGGLEYALSVRLTVDQTLEPKWSFYTERFVEDTRPERGLTFEDRQMIAPTRLGVYANRHLAWGKQSILLRLTEKDPLGRNILTQARRAARNHFTESGEELFKEVVGQIVELGSSVGVKLTEDISARLDVEGISVTSGGISLHEGDVPLRLLGMGSARLLVAALQDRAAASAPFALIDEVEHGLEPHRISRLLRYLKSERDNVRGQLFVTTHSPVVLQELNVNDLAIVRRDMSTGNVTVASAKTDIAGVDSQGQLRTTPSAYLARSVLVCEGKTEVGIVRGLDQYWAKNKFEPLATASVCAMNGNGKDAAPKVAKYFRNLQYRVALFLDNDKDPDDPEILPALKKLGVKILRWENGKATEDVLFCDIGGAAVRRLVELLEDEEGLSAIPDQINSIAGPDLVSGWSDLKSRCAESKMRAHLAACAKIKSCSWIKNRLALCEAIGIEVLGPELDNLKGGNAACVKELRAWIDSE
ncbi:MAG: AAA family ATPase [Deltaproteobacteria bacterium]|nr:AAA family ATPase [Deltaproteobacteria bacterium]